MKKDKTLKLSNTTVDENLHVEDFVRDATWKRAGRFGALGAYRLYLVTDGRGKFITLNAAISLRRGDVVLVSPDQQFYMSNTRRLEMAYVTFRGTLARALADRIERSPNGVLAGKADNEIFNFLNRAQKNVTPGNAQLVLQGALLYILGLLHTEKKPRKISKSEACIQWMEQQVENRYMDSSVSLTTLSAEHGYQPKYVSYIFKRIRGKNFTEYLTEIRLENARRLLENGFTSIKQVASLSGFADALYFSKLYKKRYGVAPSETAVKR